MINAIILYTILFTCFLNTMQAQTTIGFSFEPILKLSNEVTTEHSSSSTAKEKNVFNSYVTVKFIISPKLNEELVLSVRPGFCFGGLFTGINNDLMLFYLLSPYKYLIGGLNLHLNSGGGSHSQGRNNILIPFTTCGIGFNISERSFIEIQLMISLNSVNYGYTRELSSSSPFVIYSNYSSVGMLKLSFGLQW